MPDIAKKTRVINRRQANQMKARQRNLFTIDKQISTLQRQEGYYKTLENETRQDFYNCDHEYTFEYREQINCQLLYLAAMKLQVQQMLAHLKQMRLAVSLGNF